MPDLGIVDQHAPHDARLELALLDAQRIDGAAFFSWLISSTQAPSSLIT